MHPIEGMSNRELLQHVDNLPNPTPLERLLAERLRLLMTPASVSVAKLVTGVRR